MVTLTYQERFKTVKGVFDAFTKRNLFELQSRGIFDELISPLKVGKESNVFIASCSDKDGGGKLEGEEKYVIVKIYRVQNCDFSGMYNYIARDPRYESLKKRRREIIFAWVKREFLNLDIAYKAKVNVVKAIAVKNNVLVLELIGDKKSGDVALPLKDSVPLDPSKFLDQLILEIRKLYKKAGLVHGDLSAFNILNLNEKPVLIDFSQGTLVKSGAATELLKRDIRNVLKFFKKHRVIRDFDEVFEKIVK